jgi:hypothetical protein
LPLLGYCAHARQGKRKRKRGRNCFMFLFFLVCFYKFKTNTVN